MTSGGLGYSRVAPQLRTSYGQAQQTRRRPFMTGEPQALLRPNPVVHAPLWRVSRARPSATPPKGSRRPPKVIANQTEPPKWVAGQRISEHSQVNWPQSSNVNVRRHDHRDTDHRSG